MGTENENVGLEPSGGRSGAVFMAIRAAACGDVTYPEMANLKFYYVIGYN